jgi:murein DD-endopeptidase MepM/ murein hydrolase activator NlpD
VLHGQDVTVLYGHLDRSSFRVQPGDRIERGQRLASLAAPRSEDSGITRKHLHLGIHKGRDVEMLGYVQTERELDAFIDPRTVVP